ncbi:MAG: hypothetical protein MJK04_09245 [Psychrosphaera sp.]|nr:hypothetical protein [Psychrosphaera sp.]
MKKISLAALCVASFVTSHAGAMPQQNNTPQNSLDTMPVQTKRLFKQLLANSRRKLSAQQQTVLLKDFISHRSEQKLESEIVNFTK